VTASSLDPSKVNVQGGAALGHAIGSSGARVLTTLLYALRRTGGRRGIATLCLGGGNGVALAIETRERARTAARPTVLPHAGCASFRGSVE
jgi:acetyl-CoA acetyltransferase